MHLPLGGGWCGSSGGSPGGCELAGVASQAAGLFFDKALVEGAQALACERVDFVVPLEEPGNEVVQAFEQRAEALGRPAFLVFALEVVGGQGLGLLQVVPALPSPGQVWGRTPARRPSTG